MVVKVYVSGISGNKEVKKRQQRVLMILDSKSLKYQVIDIADPVKEEDKDFMQNNSTSFGGTACDSTPKHPLPPQIFNDEVYCGDYDQFDMANEVDELEKFLKLAPDDATVTSNAEIHLGNGDVPEQNSKSIEPDTQNGGDDPSEAVVGSTTNEEDQPEVFENGRHESNDIGGDVSEDGVDSSNAEAE